MSAFQTSDPDTNFFEILKVGRDWHWSHDVTIYYISQTKGTFRHLKYFHFKEYLKLKSYKESFLESLCKSKDISLDHKSQT